MRPDRIASFAGLFLVSAISATVLGANPVVRDQHWPRNSSGVDNSGFTVPEGVVTDVTTGGVLDHIDIPMTLRNQPNGGVLNWFIFDAQDNKPLGSQPRASGFLPNTYVDGLVTISLNTYGLRYHAGDQFTFAIQGSGEGDYLWWSYRGLDAKLHRQYQLLSSDWSLDDPPLNPPPSYAPGYSTYMAIPEPTSLLLAAIGLPFLCRRGRNASSR